MRFAQLEVFCAVYKHNSVSRASEDLIVTQPAVSLQLKSLERELGVQLFERVGRILKPLPAADMLYKYASNILNLRTEAEVNLEQFRLGLSGQLVLGVATGTVYCMPGILKGYEQALSKVKLALQTDIADRIRERAIQEEIDFGLVWGPVNDARLESIQLAEHEYVLIAPSNHPLAQQNVVEPDILGQYPLVFPPPGTSTRHYIEGMLRSLGIVPKITVELPTTDAMKWAVIAGLGFSFLSLPAVELEIAAGLLTPLHFEKLHFSRPIELIYSKRPNHSAVVTRFIEYVSNHPYWQSDVRK